MKYEPGRASGLVSLFPLAASWVAAFLIAAAIIGLWFLVADDSSGMFSLLAIPLGVVAAVGIHREHSRARTARQFHAALDAYADREIARERRRKAQNKPRTFSTAVSVARNVRVSRARPIVHQ